ncbi:MULTISPECIES: hypothetical protein [unclassified Mesorhizobium]|uniref:hypothetical protein n=1 Tax=unclassified Mesorhizobium TaxID=325217 RepID=UPI001CCC3BBE|nr:MULTISPECIES: hypothetical protein [unclassified Mesorhizobium]MBZ9812058.1 hypothetical protein [Mesorhizobium sp. ESP-6-2]MBZ9945260.1 hypothetical protein [Mesorhizobium sp. BR1-1-13]
MTIAAIPLHRAQMSGHVSALRSVLEDAVAGNLNLDGRGDIDLGIASFHQQQHRFAA